MVTTMIIGDACFSNDKVMWLGRVAENMAQYQMGPFAMAPYLVSNSDVIHM
jgi:hypothetical protein